METDSCSIYTSSKSGRQWRKPDEIMKLRKKKSSVNSMKRTLEKRTGVKALSPMPPKPNPFKTKSSDIKQLDKENKIKVLSQGNLKVCSMP